QVPEVTALVDVWRLRELQAGARPERTRRLHGLAGLEVDAHLLDAEVLAEVLAEGHQARVRHVRIAVVVPGEVGVDAPDAVDGGAVAPRPGGVGRGEH